MPPYPRVANEFFDPAGNLATYQWHVNALEQEGPFRSSNVEFEGSSDGTVVIPTGGSYEPLLITLTGTILHKAQNIQFWKWRHIENSFRFTDFEGSIYGVSMLSYEPKMIRVALNPADPLMQGYKIEYSMQLWVMGISAGPLADAVVPTG